MDSPSIGEYGPPPWDRDVYVPLIEKLTESGVKVIGFDLSFSTNPREKEASQALAQAMQAAGNVVFGFIFEHVGDPSPPGSEPTTLKDGGLRGQPRDIEGRVKGWSGRVRIVTNPPG